MDNKKGFTLVEVIVSVVLIMAVMFYLLRTIIVTSNKSNELLTLQEYSVYENNFLNTFYEDVDLKIEDVDKLKGVRPDSSNTNKIQFLDMNTNLILSPSDDKIEYNNVVYKLPSNVKLQQKNGEYYSIEYIDNIYDETTIIIVNLFLKVYDKDEIIKLMYQGTLDQGSGWTVTCHWNNASGSNAEDVKTIKMAHNRVLYESMCGNYTNGVLAKEGWYTAATGGTQKELPFQVTSDIDIYAHWATAGYTVTFDKNSANATGSMNSITVPMKTSGGTNAVTLTPVGYTWEGHEFTGWNTKADGTGTSYLDKATYPAKTQSQLQDIINNYDGEVVLYAQWQAKINYVYVKINMNEGSLASAHGASISNSGYYILKDNSTIIHKIAYGSSVGSNGLADYNNHTSINIVKTGYDAKPNAEYFDSSNTSRTFNQTQNYNASDFCDASKADCTVVLKVNWQPQVYSVTLDKQGGHDGTNNIYEKYNTGYYLNSNGSSNKMATNANPITKPEYKGYIFNGYYTAEECNGKKYIDANGYLVTSNASTKNFTTSTGSLYACWKGIEYTIVYHGNGGKYEGSEIWTDPRKFVFGNSYTGKNRIIYTNDNFFVKTGYTFTGWKTKAGYAGWSAGYPNSNTVTWRWANTQYGIGDETTNVLDLYAQWSSSPYVLTLNPNSGTYNNLITSSTKSMTYNSTDNNSIGAATKTGYTFKGWYKEKGTSITTSTWGTQVYDSSGNAIANTSYFTSDKKWKYTGNLTLYAQYLPNTYTITFNGNNGTPNVSSVNVVYDTRTDSNGNRVDTNKTATRSSYTFDGYWTAATGGEQVYDSSGKAVTGTGYWVSSESNEAYLLWKYTNNVTLYAHWTYKPTCVNKKEYAYINYYIHEDQDTCTGNDRITYNGYYWYLNGKKRSRGGSCLGYGSNGPCCEFVRVKRYYTECN